MKADILFTNGTIASDIAAFRGGIAVKDGKVTGVFEGQETVAAERVIDLRGKLLMPGLVDAHVHFHYVEPGEREWEGYATGSFAAAAGGVTTALDMPFDTSTSTINATLLAAKREAVKNLAVIDYGHWGSLQRDNLHELEAMHIAGVVGFKAFMCELDSIGVPTYELYKAGQQIAPWGNVLAVHAEDDNLVGGFTSDLRIAGRKDPRAFAQSRPPIAEVEAAERATLIAVETGVRLHIVHVTTSQAIETVHRRRSWGARITAETCPHYLALDEEDLVRMGPIAACTPPVRHRHQVDLLWQEVLAGRIDLIASDHCPCLPELKDIGADDIWQASVGIAGIQTMLPVLLTEGVQRRGLSMEALVRMTSFNPARLCGIYPKKGNLWTGADADLIIVDPEREWTLSKDMLLSRHPTNPFIGKVFKGAVERTYVRGNLVYSEGDIVGKPGYGQLVKRFSPTRPRADGDRPLAP